MATNLSRPAPNKKPIPVAEAKARVLELITEGLTIVAAMNAVNRKEDTYKSWRKTDKEFSASVDSIRSARSETKETGRPTVPDFETFCRDWLKQPLFPHQLRMLDVIEGRAPRDMHDSMTYRAGDQQRVLINVPPEHAKSTTFTVNYSVWMIHKNPDIRIVIMSQTRGLAEKFLYEIKMKLTSPLYRDMHLRFAPEGGWKDPDNSWTNELIYVRGKGGKVVQKDPTVQAMGLSGQIYGQRADLIFMDDVITTKNAREIEKQQIVLEREIESRLPSDQEGGGLLAILGTRVTPTDLYRVVIDIEDHDEVPVWTYFRQPAVLDYGNGDSSTWTTLWPEKWNGKSLAKKKRGDASWSLIYQQLNVSDEMTFKAEAVYASIDGSRFPGLLTDAGLSPRTAREGGMSGMFVVGGLDPATVGATAMIVAALDRETGKRWVLDGFNKSNCSPKEMREQVKKFTDIYGIHEWVIERNAFQRFLTQDPELTQFLRSRGTRLTEHYTTANKFDADWGVSTMGPLFDTCGVPDANHPSGRWKKTPETALVSMPSERQNAWMSELVQQLIVWEPSGMTQKTKTDLVMALWFTEIAFHKVLDKKRKKQTHNNSPFTTPGQRKQQGVISLVDARRRKQDELLQAGGF